MPRHHPIHDFDDHQPWPTPDQPLHNVQQRTWNLPGGRGYFSIQTQTFPAPTGRRSGTRDNIPHDPMIDLFSNFHNMLNNITGQRTMHQLPGGGTIWTSMGPPGGDHGFLPGMPGQVPPQDLFGSMLGGANNPHGPPSFLSLLSAAMGSGRVGDGVYTQEAFDRVMSQLMEQNANNGPPPASAEVIDNLPTKKIDKSMMGDDGKAECSICMDNVELGTDVAVLPCTHWFHFDCIKSWLVEHDTCPHCRKSIAQQQQDRAGPSSPERRRRYSRRSSNVSNPIPGAPDSPSALRNAREAYYSRRRPSNSDVRPRSERQTSSRSQHQRQNSETDSGRDHNNDGSNSSIGGGGILNAVRARLGL